MKALKVVAIIVVGVIALVALLVVLALTPAVQSWAVRKAVASQPGLTVESSRISAGLSAADLRDVHVIKDGIVIDAKSVVATYSAWDFVSHRKITVHNLAIDGLVVDLRHPTAAAARPPSGSVAQQSRTAGAPASAKSRAATPFDGILSQAKIPFDVQVDHFAVPGRALLPGAQTVTFDLRGSDLTTGKNGTIDWKADIANGTPDAPVRTLHTTGTAHVHITAERRIDVADVKALASAEGPKLPTDQLGLDAKAEQPAAGGNEGYSATVSLVRGSATEPLLTLAGQYNATAKEIAGAWTIAVRSEQLTAVLSGLGLPDVAVDGSGKFSLQPDAGAARATGEIRSDVSHLEKISPELAPIGTLRLQTAFEGGLANNAAQLERFSLNATAATGQKLADINVLQRIGYSLDTRRVTFADAKADLARISIQALPLAWAQPFMKGLTIDSGNLSLVLAVAAEADGSHVHAKPVEPLALRNVTVRNGTQKLADQLSLSVRPQVDYAADRVEAQLNDLSVSMASGDTVTGRFTADVTHLSGTPTIAFTADTQAKFVAALKPYVPVDTGPITIDTKSAGTIAGQTLQFARSTTRVSRASGPLIAAIDLVQPLAFNLQNNTLSAPTPNAEAIRAELGEIPLAWAESFAPNSKLEGRIAGGKISLVLRAIDDLTANITEPISIRGIGVTMNRQPMLQNVDLGLDLTATRKGTTVSYTVRRLEAKQGASTLFTTAVSGEAKLTAKPGFSAKGTLDADLAALMQQPAAAGASSLSRGTLKATFDAAIADTIQAQAVVNVRNLATRQSNQALGDAELRVTANVQPDGSSILKVPFTLTSGGRTSDVTLDGKLARFGNNVTFDGRVTSALLVIDDVQALAALAPASPAPTRPAAALPAVTAPSAIPPAPRGSSAPPPVARAAVGAGQPAMAKDEKPFWAGFGGKVDVDLKQINYGRDYTISGVRGSAAITPGQLALNSLEGRLKENPFKLSARIDFNGSQPQPYTLGAAVNVTNFDVGAVLQAANPNEKPQLETKVTIDAKLNGTGATLPSLAANVYGTFDVAGSQGVLRALSKKGGQAVNLGSTILGIAGALRGSDTTVAVADLTRKLEELPFDKFVMHVDRGADLNLKIGRIEFLSPDTRVVGNGEITNQPGVPIQNQPLKVTLSLAGKENMAYLLNRAGLLGGQQDDLGYYTMGTSFTISGTPSKPDSNDLWRIIAQAGLKAAAGRFLGQ